MRLAREKKAAEMLAKVAAAAPDKKKLNDFAEMLDNLEYPKMSTPLAIESINAAQEVIATLSVSLKKSSKPVMKKKSPVSVRKAVEMAFEIQGNLFHAPQFCRAVRVITGRPLLMDGTIPQEAEGGEG